MESSSLKKILYVEDEADIREIAKLALADMAGYDLCVCESGVEAIDKAAAFNPDLVLLDVMMPEMDGPEVLRKLKALPEMEQVTYVFMTAKVQSNEVDHLLSLGAVAVIPKPFDPIELPSKLAQIWEQQS